MRRSRGCEGPWKSELGRRGRKRGEGARGSREAVTTNNSASLAAATAACKGNGGRARCFAPRWLLPLGVCPMPPLPRCRAASWGTQVLCRLPHHHDVQQRQPRDGARALALLVCACGRTAADARRGAAARRGQEGGPAAAQRESRVPLLPSAPLCACCRCWCRRRTQACECECVCVSGLIPPRSSLPCCLLPSSAVQGLAERVAVVSGRNMRRALLTLEVARVQQFPFTEGQEVSPPDWELYIRVRAGGGGGGPGTTAPPTAPAGFVCV